jgi:O-succinylbenzoic acid--CoA ligase
MASPFTRIKLDGAFLEGASILRWADTCVERAANAPWAIALRDTLRELCSGDGSMVVHTSGTTGPSRHFRAPTHDLLASARLTERTFGLKAGDRVLMCLPCTFIAGKMMLVRAFVTGLDLRIVEPTGNALDGIRAKERFSFAAMVPFQLHTAWSSDPRALDRHFERVLLGGGPVSDALLDELQELRARVQLSYGSTETLTHVAVRDLNGPQRAAHFTALDDITFTLDARECLVVRTPHLSVKEHVTNDLVELIDATRFRWLGRADHVILSGGLKIHPERLEARTAAILPHPHFFTATPNERLGQAVMLIVESDRPTAEVVAEVSSLLKNVLDEHELPRRIQVVKHIPRTPSGKIIRQR